jgi:FAD/FMN-containing dehydrogenase/Fe-S oxidoreductase
LYFSKRIYQGWLIFAEMQSPAEEKLEKRFGNRYEARFLTRVLYATDASAYREIPMAVVFPESKVDLLDLVKIASEHKIPLIPRAAGTSLAGQVVGNGLVVDVSRFMTRILELNIEENWVRVQPGVIRDELNRFLKPHGLFFGPETSTANRATIGGMTGNNSCGSNSVVYGSVREHLLEAELVLHDGSLACFREGIPGQNVNPLAAKLEREMLQLLEPIEVRAEVSRQFPKAGITRRNTGYAIDMLLKQQPFENEGPAFNLCSLLAGSEGTLGLFSELKVGLSPLPPPYTGLLCIHCQSIDESLKANLVALEFSISASELMDHFVLECTKNNPEQMANRFFVEGNPAAILVVEIARESSIEVEETAEKIRQRLREENLGYAAPLVTGEDGKKIWNLRKAGLGLLNNMPGDAKPVAVIEDTAVDVRDLPAYIREFNEILKKRDLYSVHYAHAGSGELHLRPIIDLKTKDGVKLFREIATDIASLVKKYDGSLSGEHGDGRLRGEFIAQMVGEENLQLFRKIKRLWDPDGIFNPGKMVDTPPMDKQLRFEGIGPDKPVNSWFDFGPISMQQHAEQCNGSGDCRKLHTAGGTMCPSFMATRHEKDSTRARANILREMMSRGGESPLGHIEIKEVMDLCLSCKGCKSECPSNVDVGKLKAEFLQHYQQHHGIPLRSRIIGNYAAGARIGQLAPGLYNFFGGKSSIARLLRKWIGFSPERQLPKLQPQRLKNWFRKEGFRNNPEKPLSSVWFFADEFTDFQDVEIGKKAILLLQRLGYKVDIPMHDESGRAFLSKGMLKDASELAKKNVRHLHPLVTAEQPLLGLEPSGILSFDDEYPDLLRGEDQENARQLAKNCLLVEEFLVREFEAGRIRKEQFSNETKTIRLHGHCHQKAAGKIAASKKALSIPEGHQVLLIPSGCCGMAGSFGYEAEHYELSMQIGELILFPTVRALPTETIVAASGTSCRHQIADGTGRQALHPVEVLWGCVKSAPTLPSQSGISI